MTKQPYTPPIRPRWCQEFDYWQQARYSDGYTYIIRAGEDGPIKIGKAFNPEERLAELQTGAWQELSLLHVLPGYGATETMLHRHLEDHRIRGEWFDGPAIDGFLTWVEGESERMIERHRATGEIVSSKFRLRRHASRAQSTGIGMRRCWPITPKVDAPVKVRFVDPAKMERKKAPRPSVPPHERGRRAPSVDGGRLWAGKYPDWLDTDVT